MSKVKNPIFPVLLLYALCFLIRLIEYFVIRTDQTFWGEAFLHKLAGIALLYLALKAFSFTPSEIGFSKSVALRHSAMGLLLGVLIYVIAYGAEIFIAGSRGDFQSLQFYVSSYSVNGNIGNRTGLLIVAICVVGNLINVWMEEGVFRGLFQKMLQQRYSFLASAAIGSLLFGLWHVVGPARNYVDGLSSVQGMAANMILLVITSGLGSFQYALMTKMTGSLYMAMGSHFVNNTIVNLLHVSTSGGADQLMFLRITVAQTVSFLGVLIFYLFYRRSGSVGSNSAARSKRGGI